MDQITKVPADICVLDICVNEHRASVVKMYDFAETWRILDYFATQCTACDIVPLVLLLPRCHPTEGFQTGTVNLWRAVCEERGLPFLDVLPIAQRLQPDDPGSLWADLNHPAQPLSEQIASALIAAARLLPTQPHTKPARPVHSYLRRERLHDDPILRVNTRFKKTFWRIGTQTEVAVAVPPRAVLVGLGINAAQSNCHLRIRGAVTVQKDLTSILMTPDRPMWHVV